MIDLEADAAIQLVRVQQDLLPRNATPTQLGHAIVTLLATQAVMQAHSAKRLMLIVWLLTAIVIIGVTVISQIFWLKFLEAP